MDKETLLQIIKELFQEGKIQIASDLQDSWGDIYLYTYVSINGEQVYKNKESIDSSIWELIKE